MRLVWEVLDEIYAALEGYHRLIHRHLPTKGVGLLEVVKKRGEEGTDLVQGVIPWLALWYVPVMKNM